MGLTLPLLLLAMGCAKYNTYFNAKRQFDNAEHARSEALKQHQDPGQSGLAQKGEYEKAIKKAQKILDEYPGHSLTDDALFLQAKAFHRIESYRQSIRKLNLLFQNFPATPYMEEALYLQGLNYLLIGALDSSQDYLDQLAKKYPKSKYQAETRKVSGDNAFAMEDWEAAAASYREYLDLEGEVAERDRVGLRLAECYWELEEYQSAADVLQDVSQNTDSAELAFRARLLRARVHARMGDFDIVDLMVDELREVASIYESDGEVVLIEAEARLAQNRPDDAAPLLESMPAEWETPSVKARAAEILGYIFLARGEWEEAREKFQTALTKKDVLDDAVKVERLNGSLKDFLAADQALPDAKGHRVASLKLLQANSLLFGFDRPHMAASLYAEAAVDTAADTTVAARAFYGAYLTYDRYLDEPDSAAIFRNGLESNFPDSPQAFEARADTNTDLLGYLLAIRSAQQEDNYANLSWDERTALEQLDEVEAARAGSAGRSMHGVRRRMVYLSRRDFLVYPPPPEAVAAITSRQEERMQEHALDAMRRAEFDSLRALGAGLTDSSQVGTGQEVIDGDATVDSNLPAEEALDPANQEVAGRNDSGEQTAAADDDATAEEDAEDEDAKKKKQDEGWDFLR